MEFGFRPKLPGQTRTVSAQDTVRRAMPVARRFGLTRLTDVTRLDRVGIPVYTAVAPKSDDILSVYNGKGVRRIDAIAGALMETIERQAALRARPPLKWCTLAGAGPRAIPPDSILMRLADGHQPHRPFAWVTGFDALTGEEALVPAGFAGYLWPEAAENSPFWGSNSQGLASGNCLEEAVAQAICEWIERDAWTLGELGSHFHPRALAERATGVDPCDHFLDDLDLHPSLDLTGIGEPVDGLLRKFAKAGFTPLVRDITSDLGIPVIVASMYEDQVPGFPQAHTGVGCHPDIRVAVVRALTEAAQSRAVDIQAVREDIAPAEGDGLAAGLVIHTRRIRAIDRRRWLISPSTFLKPWQECESKTTSDVLNDLQLLLSRLKRAGVASVAVVDFSPPDSGLAVVRVVIPGLEAWAADRARFGQRAAAHWRALGAAV